MHPEYKPLTPVQIEAEVRRLSHEMERLKSDFVEQSRAAAEAEAAYRVSYARHYLQSKEATVAAREADAMVRCGPIEDGGDGTMLARKLSAAIAEATKQAHYTTRAQLSGVQSLARQLSDEMRNA